MSNPTVREKGEKVKELMVRASNDAKPILEQIGMSPEAFARVAFNAVLTNPKILDCEPQSLRRAVLECAQRGLLPDGDSAAIIPRKGKATFQIGYKGMCDLARRAIPGCGIRTQVVTNKDEWVYKEGLTLVLDHERDPMTWPDESNVIAAYAVVEMPSGVKESEVMLRCDIDHIRKNYAHASSEAWAKEFAEQCKKTVLRRLGKRLPIRSGLLTAAEPVVPLTDPFDEETIEHAQPSGDPEPDGDPDPAAEPLPARQSRTRRTTKPRQTQRTAREPERAPEKDPEEEQDQEQGQDQESFPDAGF